jgi:hypothetical protein
MLTGLSTNTRLICLKEFGLITNTFRIHYATEDFSEKDTRDRFIGVVEPRFNITDWLYIKGRAGFDKYNCERYHPNRNRLPGWWCYNTFLLISESLIST